MVGNTVISSLSLEPKIAACIGGETALTYAKIAKQQKADLLEVRCDLFEKCESDSMVEMFKILKGITEIPILATVRTNWESPDSGHYTFRGSEEERLVIFRKIMKYVDAVDIELNSTIREQVFDEAEKYSKPTIVSYHNFQKTESLETLKKIVNDAYNTRGNIIKISTMAYSKEDTVSSLRLLLSYTKDKIRSANKPIAVISMGKIGRMSRIAFPLFGSCLTYAHLDKNVYAAPGQMDICDMQRIMEI